MGTCGFPEFRRSVVVIEADINLMDDPKLAAVGVWRLFCSHGVGRQYERRPDDIGEGQAVFSSSSQSTAWTRTVAGSVGANATIGPPP
jgi:hypothetical protein